MKHKHSELIKRWADDTSLVVEYRQRDGNWELCPYPPGWNPRFAYRIVEPKKTERLRAYLTEYELCWLRETSTPSPTWVAIPSMDKEIQL